MITVFLAFQSAKWRVVGCRAHPNEVRIPDGYGRNGDHGSRMRDLELDPVDPHSEMSARIPFSAVDDRDMVIPIGLTMKTATVRDLRNR